MTTVEQHVAVGLAYRVASQAILHRTAVNVELLARGAAIGVRWQAHPAVQPHVAALLVYGHGLGHEAAAEQRPDALLHAAAGQAVQRAAAGA